MNDPGRMEAKLTGMYLKKYRSKTNFDCIYTSPLVRASETAEIIKNELDDPRQIPIISLDDLREHYSGKHSGKTEEEKHNDHDFDDFYKLVQKQGKIKDPIKKFKYYDKIDKCLIKLGAESYKDGVERAKKVFDFIFASPYDKIIIVTHSGTIWEMLYHLTHNGHNSAGSNCSICYIEYKNGNYEIITMPNNDHMNLINIGKS